MSTPRRTPIQARSRARVDAILDAADAVFLERGFGAATTNHVAARAGTSIGSLYRFFPDKDALLVALAERYGERFMAMATALTDPAEEVTLAERVGRGIDTFNTFLVANPGFRTLLDQADHPALRAGAEAQNQLMTALIQAHQARLAPTLDAEDAAIVAEVTRATLDALQRLSVSRDDRFRARVVAEARRLVVGYLAARLGVGEDAPG
jgi:AcrR family transcriptional regulator